MLSVNDESWHLKALCTGPETVKFFLVAGESREQRDMREASAKLICGECVAQPQCLEFALRVKEPHGIWGGLTEAERRCLTNVNDVTAQSLGRLTVPGASLTPME